MSFLNIRKVGDQVLRVGARPVKHTNSFVQNLLDDMVETMRAARGVGLAAPQVGISKRVVVVETMEGLFEMVNPEIVASSGSQIGIEGCLSIPNKIGEVERAEKVTVSALDRHGKQIWVDGEGFLARVMQHEIDHLDGVLFIDRAHSVHEVEDQKRDVEPLRILFMGTPQFAVLPLYAILTSGHKLIGVVTQPDRPAGRHYALQVCPVKEFSQKHRLPVFQPESASRKDFVQVIRAMEPDLIVVVAFGQILSKTLLEVPKLGTINLHASLLPKLRGPAPIHWALMNGEEVTGVTTMYVVEKLDAGDIILQREVPITRNETLGSLSERLSVIGADVLAATIDLIAAGKAPRTPQEEAEVTYAPMIKPEHEIINWSNSAVRIANQVRGMDPWPGAYTYLDGRKVKIWKAVVKTKGGKAGRPGEVIDVENEITVATGEGSISIQEVQMEGKRRMKVTEFLKGHNLSCGAILG